MLRGFDLAIAMLVDFALGSALDSVLELVLALGSDLGFVLALEPCC